MDPDPLDVFLAAASAPRDSGHATGTLDEANALLVRHPDLPDRSIHAAAVLGRDDAVRRFIDADPAQATAPGGPWEWDPLTHLCFSRYLRLDRSRSDGFVRAAAALLDAGGDPNTGWWEPGHQPEPTWESALYGAAGVAHHAGLTRLLLERGADPNDDETPYHAPEGYDNEALHALVESGRLTPDSLGMILLRKTDWHDHEAIAWLLERGADPNGMTRWGKTALHNALLSDNSLAIIETLLDHGADPTLVASRPDRGGTTPAASGVALAARRGRSDVLAALERRGFPVALDGVDRLLAACARHEHEVVREIHRDAPELVRRLAAEGGQPLAEFAGNGNVEGVRLLLELGVPVDAHFSLGDGYWDVAPASTALHVAAWRARHPVVELLLAHGADPNARDGRGRTPLALAVRACVDSYWKEHRSPRSLDALLRAGARPDGIALPTGYPEADRLLRPAQSQG